MQVIAGFFSSGARAELPVHGAAFSHYVKKLAQFAKLATSYEDSAALSEDALAALVAEFVRLHAEAKQLNDRLDAVKEQLKQHAASQPREANAVLLRAGEHAVKCGYSVRVSYNVD